MQAGRPKEKAPSVAAPPAAAPADGLEGLVQGLALDYDCARSWTEFVENFREQGGDYHPQVKRIPHAAAE
jgi:hypothetical protein